MICTEKGYAVAFKMSPNAKQPEHLVILEGKREWPTKREALAACPSNTPEHRVIRVTLTWECPDERR